MVIPENAIETFIVHVASLEMDSSNPFFLHHGDNPSAMIISQLLNGDNYNS
jgi:hypothetical protein